MTPRTQEDVMQDDLGAILRALGLGDHARPMSPHQVVQDVVLPAIDRLRNPATGIDYRALLAKYMRHVVDNEGISFVWQNSHKDRQFTADELAVLEQMDEGIKP